VPKSAVPGGYVRNLGCGDKNGVVRVLREDIEALGIGYETAGEGGSLFVCNPARVFHHSLQCCFKACS